MKLSDLITACETMRRQHGDIHVVLDVDEDCTGTPDITSLEFNPVCKCSGNHGECGHGPWIGIRASYYMPIESIQLTPPKEIN